MAELASPESWCTGNGTVGSNPTPSARPRGPGRGRPTEIVSWGLIGWEVGAPSGPPGAARRNRKSLRDSRFELFDCERGAVAPPFTLSPRSRGQRTKFAAICFFGSGSTCDGARARERRPPGRHSPPKAGGSAYR